MDLEHIFTHHPPSPTQFERYAVLRKAALEFAQVLVDNTIPGADQTAAIRKVREAVMTANASIALNGRL